MSNPLFTEKPLLSDSQRSLVGFALSLLALLFSVSAIVFIIWALGEVVGFFSGVLWPIAVAAILALIMRPAVEELERRLHGRRMAAVLIFFSVFVLAFAGVLLGLIPPLTDQLLDFFAYLPWLFSDAVEYVQHHYPSWVAMADHLMENPLVNETVKNIQEELAKLPSMVIPSLRALGSSVFLAFGFVTHLAIIPIYLFFFLLVKSDPTRRLHEHLPFLREPIRGDAVFLLREFFATIVSFFRGQLLIGIIMGGLYALGYSIIGLRFGLVIGLSLGVLNIVPYLGTIIGLACAVPLAMFQPGGGWKLVLLVLLVKLIVQNIEGWVLTPKIMGDRTGLHPMVIIVAIFFWGTAFHGIIGMILAIPLTAFFVTAWRLAERKYFGQLV